MAVEAKPAILRHQLETAHELAKSRIAFVVIPAITDDQFVELCKNQVQALQQLAVQAEGQQGNQDDPS